MRVEGLRKEKFNVGQIVVSFLKAYSMPQYWGWEHAGFHELFLRREADAGGISYALPTRKAQHRQDPDPLKVTHQGHAKQGPAGQEP